MNINEACLVSFVTNLAGRQLSFNELHDLMDNVKCCIPQQVAPVVSPDSIAALLKAIQEKRKIEAIKEHRGMTGYGLKESKDVIEQYWPHSTA